MATVHLGRTVGDGGFKRIVAIKQLHAQYAREEEFCTMFLDEARVVARIHHPNVVPTLDLIAENDELFIVMDYVEGESLSKLMKALTTRDEAVPPRIALAIASGMLRGLHAAHTAKSESGEPLHIVHRDVSPQNVLVGVDGYPRVLDFGIARALGRLHASRQDEVRGKISYMSPEQLEGEDVDARADVFAAAIVVWEMLAGRQLNRGRTIGEQAHRVLNQVIEPPSEVSPNPLPDGIDEIVMRGLSRDVDERWPNAHDFADALHELGVAAPGAVGKWVAETASKALGRRQRLRKKVEMAPLPDLNVASDLRVFSMKSKVPSVIPPSMGAADSDRESYESIDLSTMDTAQRTTGAAAIEVPVIPTKSTPKWQWIGGAVAILGGMGLAVAMMGDDAAEETAHAGPTSTAASQASPPTPTSPKPSPPSTTSPSSKPATSASAQPTASALTKRNTNPAPRPFVRPTPRPQPPRPPPPRPPTTKPGWQYGRD